MGRSKERQAILDLLKEQLPDGMCPREIARTLEKNYHTVRTLLRKMEEAGDITCKGRKYLILSRGKRDDVPPSPFFPDGYDDADARSDTTGNNAPEEPQADVIPASSLPNLEIPQRPTERKKTIERADTFTRLNKSDVHTINGTKPHQHLETDFQEDTQATYVRQEKNTLQTTRHGVSPDDKQHCPHHPYERHVRFDSSGQA